MKKEKNKCPTCGHVIDKRKISLFFGMLTALRDVEKWCKEKGRHEFKMREVKHLFTPVQYATFGNWVYFGGIIYKGGVGKYGLNMERCDLFFKNKLVIPMWVMKDPVTKQIEKGDYGLARDIPNLTKFLDSEGLFEPEYKEANQHLL